MAKKVKSKYQGKDGAFYIVNPAGAVHSCTREHAAWRLRTAGWRLAEDDEIEVYLETRVQRYDRPIASPWSPEPEIEADIPEAEGDGAPEVTEAAAALAKEHDVNLARVKGSGAGGRVLVRDVQALIEAE